MKPMASIIMGVAAISLCGCFCKAVPRHRSLGHLDLTQTNSTFRTTFVAPKGGASFVLAFPAEKVASGPFCSHPDWPLEVSLQIRTPKDPSFLLSKDFGRTDFQFTSWHTPATSLLFNWDVWPGIFTEGKEYELSLSMKRVVPELGTVEVYLHWVDE